MSIKSKAKEKDPEPMLDVPNLTDSDLTEEESDDNNDVDNDNNPNVNGSDADASSEEEESEMFQSDEDSNPSVVGDEVGVSPVSADDLRKEGNKVFGDGNYTLAIQKYQEAINTGKCSLEDKVKCYSNIAHCYNKKQQYREGMKHAWLAIESKPGFSRAYQRCAESHTQLDQHAMAAVTLMKGVALNPGDRNLKEQLEIINKKARNEAQDYVERNHSNNPRNINLRKLEETGLKPPPAPVKTEGRSPSNQGSKDKSTARPALPDLVASSSSDEDSEQEDEDSDRDNPDFESQFGHGGNKRSQAQNMEDGNVISNKVAQPPVAKSKEEPRMEAKKDLNSASAPVPKKPTAKNAKKENEAKNAAIVENFNRVAKEGSTCYKENIFQRCKDSFAECLGVMHSNYDALKFNKPMKSSEDVVVIKFLYARACTGLDTYKDIISGYDKLNEIIDIHKNIKFPAVYLGLASMYQKLNRFEHALNNAQKGVEWFENNLPCVTYSYPGMSADPIEETKKEYLLTALKTLSEELKYPPSPDAICKLEKCLKFNQDNHMIPSKKIYRSDPDFKPYYRIFCNSTCILDYHEICWSQIKAQSTHIVKGTKIPSEKDFCGTKCLTPDCEGIILKIQIIDSMDYMTKTVEDRKLIERLELEALKKEEERKRKEKEAIQARENLQKKVLENKLKKSKKKERSRSKSTSEKESSSKNEPTSETSGVLKNDNNNDDKEVNNENHDNMPDLSAIPVAILRKNKEDKENDEDNDNKKKLKKSKERAVLSLEEFNQERPIDDRTERLAQMKKSHENSDSTACGQGLKSFDNPNLNPNAKSFSPNSKYDSKNILSKDATEENIRDNVFQQLRKNGPMKESDKRLTSDLRIEATKLIQESKGLIQLLKADERFGSYANYLCLKGDAEKAKKLKDQDDRMMMDGGSNKSSDLGDIARKLKEQLLRESSTESKKKGNADNGFGLAEASNNPSILDTIKRQTNEAKDLLPTLRSGPTFRTEGVQTDVSSVEMDEVDDPFMLQQTNQAMAEELQDVRDKLFRIQNESKLEARGLAEKVASLTDEKAAMNIHISELKATMQNRDQVFREATKTQRDLRTARDNYDNEHKKVQKLEAEMREFKRKLEAEQKVSYTYSLQVQKIGEKDNMINNLRLKCLKADYDAKKAILTQKRQDNENLIEHLTIMLSSATNQAGSILALNRAIESLNNYSANIYVALESLGQAYEEGKRRDATELEFNTARVESPNLASIELDTLRLLTTTAYYSNSARPPQVTSPFSQQQQPPSRPAGAPTPPRSRPPPGLGGASSPGLSLPVTRSSSGASVSAGASTRTSPLPSRGPAPALGLGRLGSLVPGGHPSNAPGSAGPSLPAVGSSLAAAAGAVAGSAAPTPSSETVKPKKATQKLIEQVRIKHPQLTEEQADGYIQEMRANNKGKLSGLSITAIINGVEDLMKKDRLELQTRRVAADPNPETECSICFDAMSHNIRQLPCSHRFHRHCIDQWLSTPQGAGNTCPLCREYIVQDDQFPGLGPIGGQRRRR